MSTVIELRQKRAGLIVQAREMIDLAENESRDLSQEEAVRYEALLSEADGVLKQAERIEKQEVLERSLSETVQVSRPQPEKQVDEYDETFRYWLNNGIKGMTEKQLKLAEQRALQADVDIYGGYLIAPVQFVQTLIQAVDNQVFMRQLATVYQVSAGSEGLGAPSLDNDPADPTWTSELAIGTEDSTMSLGQRELKPHPLAKYIKVSRKLLRKVPSSEALVRNRLAYKFAVTLEAAYMTGTGIGAPLGVFTASNFGITTARDVSTGNTTTSMTFDGLKEAKYTLKGQYWPRARWIFHRDGVKQLAKLKDGDGQYIWQSAVVANEPDRLLGMPVLMSEYAPSTFTSQLYVGIVGDFSNYWIADDLNMELQRLDELYAATNQVGYIGRYEGDGMPVLNEAFVRVKLA
jgi:HK97 family phage major capsid protein